MDIQIITEGITGEQAAQILNENAQNLKTYVETFPSNIKDYLPGEEVIAGQLRIYKGEAYRATSTTTIAPSSANGWSKPLNYLSASDLESNSFFDFSYVTDGSVASNGNLGNTGNPEFKRLTDSILPEGTYTVGGYIPNAGKYFALVNEAGVVKSGSVGNFGQPSKTFTIANDGYDRVRFTLKTSSEAPGGWEDTISIVEGTSYVPAYTDKVAGLDIFAKGLVAGNATPTPTEGKNAVNLNYFSANAVAVSDMEIVESTNIAKTFILDKYIGNAGTIASGAGWAMCEISGLTEGQVFTIGNFIINTAGYASFHNGNTLVQYVGSYSNNLPKTYTWPAGATRFLFDTKRPVNDPSDSAQVMANLGAEILPYEDPAGTIVRIKGNKIGGGNSNVSKFSDLIDVPPYTGNLGKALKLGVNEVETFDALEQGGDASFNTIQAVAFAFDALEWDGVNPPPSGLEINDVYFNTDINALTIRKV